MVGHQHPCPDLNVVCGTMRTEQIELELVIVTAKKTLLPPIPALSDVMGNARKNETREAGHGEDT